MGDGQIVLEGKVAVITGAAGQIGSAIARRFLKEGARVALLDIDADALARLQSDLHQQGIAEQSLLCLACAVQDQEQIQDSFRRIDSKWGRVDIAVANAGIAESCAFVEMDLANWNRTLAVNLTGVFLTCQQASRRMIRQRSGSLITMSSTNGLMGERGLAAYNASKAGVLLLTKTMAIELAPYGIRANSLNPGFIDTGLAERSGVGADLLQCYVEKIPLGRFGAPHEVAGAAAFLASSDAAFVTGIGLVVDGGQLAEE